MDSSGNVYITGYVDRAGDLNGDGDTADTAESGVGYAEYDVFLTKFNSSGTHQWAKRFGGNGWDYGYGIYVDSNANIYLTGRVNGSADLNGDGDKTDPAESSTGYGGDDIFVTKYDSAGDILWAKRLGGVVGDSVSVPPTHEYGRDITVDANGNVYVTGCVIGDADLNGDGDRSDTAESGTGYSHEDIFVSKFDSGGTHVWAARLGGVNVEYGESIFVDTSQNVYLTGQVESDADLDGDGTINSSGPESATGYGNGDIFLSKFDSSGNNKLIKRLGGTDSDFGRAIYVDSYGSLYLSGSVQSNADLDGNGTIDSTGPENASGYGGHDIFFLKFGYSYSISGTITDGADPVSGITVTLSGDKSDTATTNTSGTYSFTSIAAGTAYTITPTMANFTFNPTNGTGTVTADVTKNFTGVFSISTPTIGSPADGAVVTSNPPTFSGTAYKTSTVTLTSSKDGSLGNTTTDGNGNWSFTPSSSLSEGEHSITAVANLYNQTSSASTAVVITISALSTPTISSPADGAILASNLPTFSGTAFKGSTVTLTSSKDGGIGNVVTDGNGNWSLTPSSSLSEGEHGITTVATLNNQTSSPSTITVTIDSTAPDSPAITPPVYSTPSLAQIAGQGEAGTTISVYVGSDLLGTTTVDSNGNWSFTLPVELGPGSYLFNITSTDSAGNTTNTGEVSIVVPQCVEQDLTSTKETINDEAQKIKVLNDTAKRLNKKMPKRCSVSGQPTIDNTVNRLYRAIKKASLPESSFSCNPVLDTCSEVKTAKVKRKIRRQTSRLRYYATERSLGKCKKKTKKSKNLLKDGRQGVKAIKQALDQIPSPAIYCE